MSSLAPTLALHGLTYQAMTAAIPRLHAYGRTNLALEEGKEMQGVHCFKCNGIVSEYQKAVEACDQLSRS